MNDPLFKRVSHEAVDKDETISEYAIGVVASEGDGH